MTIELFAACQQCLICAIRLHECEQRRQIVKIARATPRQIADWYRSQCKQRGESTYGEKSELPYTRLRVNGRYFRAA
jgi:hypothetical protein